MPLHAVEWARRRGRRCASQCYSCCKMGMRRRCECAQWFGCHYCAKIVLPTLVLANASGRCWSDSFAGALMQRRRGEKTETYYNLVLVADTARSALRFFGWEHRHFHLHLQPNPDAFCINKYFEQDQSLLHICSNFSQLFNHQSQRSAACIAAV